VVLLGSLAIAYALLIANYFVPTLRFRSDLTNVIIFGSAQVVPLIMFLILWQRCAGWKRWAACGVASIGVFQALLWGALSMWSVVVLTTEGTYLGPNRLHSMPVAGRRVSVYRTNVGATSSYGIVLRQECDLTLGVMHVRQIFVKSPASDAVIQPIGSQIIHISIPPYADRAGPREYDVELRPMLCL
jgi:hypothetical protein